MFDFFIYLFLLTKRKKTIYNYHADTAVLLLLFLLLLLLLLLFLALEAGGRDRGSSEFEGDLLLASLGKHVTFFSHLPPGLQTEAIMRPNISDKGVVMQEDTSVLFLGGGVVKKRKRGRKMKKMKKSHRQLYLIVFVESFIMNLLVKSLHFFGFFGISNLTWHGKPQLT